MLVASALPAWCGPDGLPLSYRHFVYGLQFVGRTHLRDQLARAQAFRAGQQGNEEFRSWQSDLIRVTEAP